MNTVRCPKKSEKVVTGTPTVSADHWHEGDKEEKYAILSNRLVRGKQMTPVTHKLWTIHTCMKPRRGTTSYFLPKRDHSKKDRNAS